MKKISRANNAIAVLAEDPLVQVGLSHLLTDPAHSVVAITLDELRPMFLKAVPPFSGIIIVPSSLELLRWIPVIVRHWFIHKVVLCPENKREVCHSLISTNPALFMNTTVVSIDTDVELLASILFWKIKNYPPSDDDEIQVPDLSVRHSTEDPLITRLHLLTKTECKIMKLLLNELPPAKVAQIMKRDVKTISAHKLNAMKKLHVSGVVGLHSLLVNPSFMRALNTLCLAKVLV
ncbi:hypothetical protein H0S68_25520 (plasmid) [Serratia sp. AXJ-M]|uniref:LuxR C-terminal-related transcriptional regulator n=1 Tax=Serratia sp. AXJ-M TaxID=2754727 RepID=UPI00397D4CF1